MNDDFKKFGSSVGLGLFLLVMVIIGILFSSGKIDLFGWANNMLDSSFNSSSVILHHFA